MNRWVIFAHYDKHNIIDDYVIYYLDKLKNISSDVVFVSDCDLKNAELDKLKQITSHVLAKNHGEYDWGSYKYGFEYLEKNNFINTIDELIFCNDSVYGPIVPIEPYIDKMSLSKNDFAGFFLNKFDFKNNIGTPHLQSWFLLLKKQVFVSDLFKNFIYSVKPETRKSDIVNKYEIKFTDVLSKKYAYNGVFLADCNAVYDSPYKLISADFPFCKVAVANKYFIIPFISKKNKVVAKLIKKHQNRCFKKNIFINIIRYFKNIKKIHYTKVEMLMESSNA